MRPLGLILFTLTSATTAQTIFCGSSENPSPESTRYVFTFKYTLNYDFLLAKPEAVVQVCEFAGPMVSNALSVAGPTAWMINPLDKSDELGYVASTVVVTGPAGALSALNEQVANATSRLYNHPNQMVRQLAQQIDDNFNVTIHF